MKDVKEIADHLKDLSPSAITFELKRTEQLLKDEARWGDRAEDIYRYKAIENPMSMLLRVE